MADAAQQAWVLRVLGIGGEATPGGPRPKLLPIWMEAKETVDAGIDKLQSALRAEADEDLEQIAEFGLFGASEGENVRLMVALREADGGNPKGLEKVLDAVEDYEAFLDGAPIIDLIEDNPFGVKVPLRQTLGAALKELRSLASA